jgi:hypothetical protein
MRFDITANALAIAHFRPLHAGDDYDYTFTVKTRAGVAVNLSGAVLVLTAKADRADPDSEAVLEYGSADSDQITITLPAAGTFVVHFSEADTEDLAGVWDYDIKAWISAQATHLAYGKLEFLPSITQKEA